MTTALATDPAPPPRQPVRIRPVPRREPPFDDEREPCATVTPFDRHLPFELVRPRPVTWQPRPARPEGLPEPSGWARRLLVGLVETAGGRRPLHQLGAFLSPAVHRGIGAEFERAAAAGTRHWLHRATVRSVRVTEPADGVVELCAVLDAGPRARAVAMRVERWHGHWRCTRLQLG